MSKNANIWENKSHIIPNHGGNMVDFLILDLPFVACAQHIGPTGFSHKWNICIIADFLCKNDENHKLYITFLWFTCLCILRFFYWKLIKSQSLSPDDTEKHWSILFQAVIQHSYYCILLLLMVIIMLRKICIVFQ